MLETRIGDVSGRPGADDERAVELDLEPAPEFFMVGEGAPYAVNPARMSTVFTMRSVLLSTVMIASSVIGNFMVANIG